MRNSSVLFLASAAVLQACAAKTNTLTTTTGGGAATTGGASAGTSAGSTGGAAAGPFGIGVNVSGLAGQGLVLLDNGGDPLSVTSDGAFTFAAELPDGGAYAVTVGTQPTNLAQNCLVTGGSGNVKGADVSGIAVSCTTRAFNLGGTFTNLQGTGVVVKNGAVDCPVSGGAFSCATGVNDGAPYDVQITTQPTGPTQLCSSTNNTGSIAGADVTTISFTCAAAYTLGGTIGGDGLLGDNLTLDNNGDETTLLVNATSFTFPTPLVAAQSYNITVTVQPSTDGSDPSKHNQVCLVTSGGTGTMPASNLASVLITCQTTTVSPYYTNGALWASWVQNDPGTAIFTTANFLSRSTPACVAAGLQPDYYSCLHGGEYRTFTVFGETATDACDHLQIDPDSDGAAFRWQCFNGNGSVVPASFTSYALNDGVALADLIDFDTPAFRPLTVNVLKDGVVLMATDPQPWWTNPLSTDLSLITNGFLPAGPGTIFLFSSPTAIAGHLVLDNGESLVGPRDPAVMLSTMASADLAQRGLLVETDLFNWVEGNFDATNIDPGSTTNPAPTGGVVVAGQFDAIDHVTVSHSPSNGILVYGSSDCLLNNVAVEQSSGSGAAIDLFSSGNIRLYNALVTGGAATATGINSTDDHDIFYRLRIFDLGAGMVFNGSNNTLVDVVAAGLGGDGLSVLGNTGGHVGTWLSGATFANLGGTAISFTDTRQNAFYDVAVSNAAAGLSISSDLFASAGNPQNVFENLAVSGSGTALSISETASAPKDSNTFAGEIFLGANTMSCSDVSDSECTTPGLSTAHTGVSLDGVFGETADAVNLTPGVSDVGVNVNGADAPTPILDWFDFQSSYEGWGADDEGDGSGSPSAYPNPSLRSTCDGSGYCHVWGFALVAPFEGEPANPILGVLSPPADASQTATQTWLGDSGECATIPGALFGAACTSVYLPNAIEIFGDGVGNDNGLCEANERCVFAPNIGAYQGDFASALDSAVNGVADASLPAGTNGLGGIKLFVYHSNGTF